MKILNAIWFTEIGSIKPIGIVICEDEHIGKKQAYIGTGFGNDEEADSAKIAARNAKLIAAHGAKFHASTAIEIAAMLTNGKA